LGNIKRCSFRKNSKILLNAILAGFEKHFPSFFSPDFYKDTFREFAIASGINLAFKAKMSAMGIEKNGDVSNNGGNKVL